MTEKDLPVFEAVKPIGVCGNCGNQIYPDGKCQSAGPQPSSCCLHGEEWRQRKLMVDMRNTYVRS